MSIGTELQLETLNREIADLETRVARLESERNSLDSAAASASSRVRYLRLAKWIRSPSASMDSWPIVALLNELWIVGMPVLLALLILFDSWEYALSGGIFAAIIGDYILAKFLFVPSGPIVQTDISQVQSQTDALRIRLEEINKTLSDVGKALTIRSDTRNKLIESGMLLRERLLQRDWKALRGDEWEAYLIEVCTAIVAPESNEQQA